MRKKGLKWLGGSYVALIFLFLYIPVFVLVAYSFNESRFNAVWTGFTFDWFRQLWEDRAILAATQNSLVIAVISTVVSTAIGTLAAMALHKYRFRGKNLFESILYLPIVIPEIVMGVSLLLFFVLIDMPLGRGSVSIAHIAFNISFVTVIVRARLHSFDPALEEASMDLGANHFQTFFKVTLPLIFPGVLAGALIAFTLSLDDFVISFFTAGVGSTTLPVQVYSMMRRGVTPKINALSTVILFVVVLAVFTGKRLMTRRQGVG